MNPPIDFFERMQPPFYLLFHLLLTTGLMVGSIPNVGELMLASLPDSSEFVVTISESNSWYSSHVHLLHLLLKYSAGGLERSMMVWECAGTQWRRNCIKFRYNNFIYFDNHRYTRSGLPLQLLQSFVDSFSDSFLDGEIWYYSNYHPLLFIFFTLLGLEGVFFWKHTKLSNHCFWK